MRWGRSVGGKNFGAEKGAEKSPGTGIRCVIGSSPNRLEWPHPELVHWWLLVHSSWIIVIWGRKENKFYCLMHFPARQHTFKEYGINFYAHVLLKNNWKFDFYAHVLLKRNWKFDLENNMLESFGKIIKIAKMSAGFWKYILLNSWNTFTLGAWTLSRPFLLAKFGQKEKF